MKKIDKRFKGIEDNIEGIFNILKENINTTENMLKIQKELMKRTDWLRKQIKNR